MHALRAFDCVAQGPGGETLHASDTPAWQETHSSYGPVQPDVIASASAAEQADAQSGMGPLLHFAEASQASVHSLVAELPHPAPRVAARRKESREAWIVRVFMVPLAPGG